MTWQTIDSAPKDGTPFLIASTAGTGPTLGMFEDNYFRLVHNRHKIAGAGIWFWQPLPAPPDAKCERASGAQDGLPSLSMPQSEQFARNCLAYCAKHGVALNTELSLWSDLLAHRDALALAQRERDALRTIISRCADALGNGAMVSPDCSPAFMSKLPGEIGLYTAFLREDRDTWKERAEKDKARVAELEAALLPIADIEGSDEPPPLTYGDLRRARNLLNGGSDA